MVEEHENFSLVDFRFSLLRFGRWYFGILGLEQVVNVTLSKRRFQIYLGLAVNRLAMDYVAW